MPTGDSPNPESEAAAMANGAEKPTEAGVENSAVERAPDAPEKQTPEQTGERLKELAVELDTLLEKADKISIEQSNIEANLEGPVSSQLEKTAEVSSSPEVSAMRSKLAGLKLEMKNIEQSYSATLRMIETLKEANKESKPAKVDNLSQEPKDSKKEARKELDERINDIQSTIIERQDQLKKLEDQLDIDEQFVGGEGQEDHLAMQTKLKNREASGWSDTNNTRVDAPNKFQQELTAARSRIEMAKKTIPSIKDRIKGFTTTLKHAREDRDRL